MEVLDQLIGSDEVQQQGKDRAMALVRDEMAALGMELGKMQGDAAVCRDMAAAADVLREYMPVLEQAKVRYERVKERQADRDGLIGAVTRMEENLKTYDRFDALQENLKVCRKETESLEKRLGQAALEERQWKERNDRDEKILESLRQAGEEYQAALTAGERLGEFSGRIGLLAEELAQYGQERKKLEAFVRASNMGQQARRAAGQTMPTGRCTRDSWTTRRESWLHGSQKASPVLYAAPSLIRRQHGIWRRETRQPRTR